MAKSIQSRGLGSQIAQGHARGHDLSESRFPQLLLMERCQVEFLDAFVDNFKSDKNAIPNVSNLIIDGRGFRRRRQNLFCMPISRAVGPKAPSAP